MADLAWLAGHLRQAYPEVQIGFDLSDMSGYAYYSGVRFAIYGGGSADALARGGRYDEIGAVFGRNRPAVGFSVIDLKNLAALVPSGPARAAVRAPWAEDDALRAAWIDEGVAETPGRVGVLLLVDAASGRAHVRADLGVDTRLSDAARASLAAGFHAPDAAALEKAAAFFKFSGVRKARGVCCTTWS